MREVHVERLGCDVKAIPDPAQDLGSRRGSRWWPDQQRRDLELLGREHRRGPGAEAKSETNRIEPDPPGIELLERAGNDDAKGTRTAGAREKVRGTGVEAGSDRPFVVLPTDRHPGAIVDDPGPHRRVQVENGFPKGSHIRDEKGWLGFVGFLQKPREVGKGVDEDERVLLPE